MKKLTNKQLVNINGGVGVQKLAIAPQLAIAPSVNKTTTAVNSIAKATAQQTIKSSVISQSSAMTESVLNLLR